MFSVLIRPELIDKITSIFSNSYGSRHAFSLFLIQALEITLQLGHSVRNKTDQRIDKTHWTYVYSAGKYAGNVNDWWLSPNNNKYFHDGSNRLLQRKRIFMFVCLRCFKSNLKWFLLIVVTYETFSLTIYANYLTVHIFVLDFSFVTILIKQKAIRGGLFNKQSSPKTGLLCGAIELLKVLDRKFLYILSLKNDYN